MTNVKVFTGTRGNGKTRKLMEYAAANNYAVLTSNKQSLVYKAQRYGIDVPIYDINDLEGEETCAIMGENFVVDDCAVFIEALLYGLHVHAVSVTNDFPESVSE